MTTARSLAIAVAAVVLALSIAIAAIWFTSPVRYVVSAPVYNGQATVSELIGHLASADDPIGYRGPGWYKVLPGGTLIPSDDPNK